MPVFVCLHSLLITEYHILYSRQRSFRFNDDNNNHLKKKIKKRTKSFNRVRVEFVVVISKF